MLKFSWDVEDIEKDKGQFNPRWHACLPDGAGYNGHRFTSCMVRVLIDNLRIGQKDGLRTPSLTSV